MSGKTTSDSGQAMNLSDEQIERIFEAWFASTDALQCRGVKKDFVTVFKAAITLLMPIIEKQAECIDWIAKTDTASHVHGPDVIWLSSWRNTRKQAAINTKAEVEKYLVGLGGGE